MRMEMLEKRRKIRGKKMEKNMPKDPVMLLSFVNTQLRTIILPR